jgi:hypothetical protein
MKIIRLTAVMVIFLGLLAAPVQSAQGARAARAPRGQDQATGGVNILGIQPRLVCVGDTFTLEGAASVDLPDFPEDIPLAPLAYISLEIKADKGQVTPDSAWFPNDFTYFTITYKATTPGVDIIRISLNDGLASTIERVEVQKSCDYDAYVTTVMRVTADIGYKATLLGNTAGSGVMKRLRDGEPYLQGEGTWFLESNMITQPPECVQWYMPPLTLSGPFDLDGKVDPEAETLDVILQFKPRSGPPVYHGKSICVDADGNQGEGWSYAQGGDQSLASKIQATYPLGGGSQQVELQGKGLEMMQSQADVEYQAVLTIIPR